MIITKMLIDTANILVGCECYSETVETITRYKGKSRKGMEIKETMQIFPKDAIVLSIEDLHQYEQAGNELYTNQGETLTMKGYDDVTNIGEPIKRYTLAYASGKELLSMQKVRAVKRDIINAENLAVRDLEYLINSFTRNDRFTLEAI